MTPHAGRSLDAREKGVKVGNWRGKPGSKRRSAAGDRSREEVGCQIRSRRKSGIGSTREEVEH